MKPTQPRQRRQVLSEEEYTSTLNSIVQREFFPDLPHLERQAAVLERRSQGDIAGAVAVRRAARRLEEHTEALTAQEEEAEQDLENGQLRRSARPLHQESVTGFHARVTNEDDEEFASVQKEEINANRKRLEELFRPSEDSRKVPLLTMASDQFQPEQNRITASEWNQPSVRNGLFFNPTPIANRSESEQAEGAIKLIENDHTETKLMPPPQSRSSPAQRLALVEYIPKNTLEKKIEPSQTRFPRLIPQLSATSTRPLAETQSDTESGTDGFTTDASTDLDGPLRPIDHERERHKRKLERETQSFVTMTPLLVPGAGNQSPITTWGTVDGTPLVLSGQEHKEPPKSSFSVSAENSRERAARKAEEKLARRAKRAKATHAKTRGSASLTPAAQALLNKTRRTPSRTPDAFASALRSSYTPKLRSKSSSTIHSGGRVQDSAYNATPLASCRSTGKQPTK